MKGDRDRHVLTSLDRPKNQAAIEVRPFARLAPRERAAMEAEGQRLLSFLAPDAKSVGLRFA